MVVPLQTTVGSPVAIAGTVGLFALFLSVTAHIAARNVLGDVAIRNAFGVGPLPAGIAVLSTTFGVSAALALPLALAADAALIKYLYDRPWRLTLYVVAIHLVVTIILGALVFSLLALWQSAPG
ncbi:hypothetical protein AUR64_00960 [Haloprofundus marisrubri]|uniref:Yip1 domain-containing protein n=1 Tax=Haloprofundus marisrubri TaxID=1514971 RepID=A0A0W1R467_9EURY|nr:hypothetical protein [Haloprofundus marisrubri]KTG08174.1 hypothetical protein AUR64_00960 [Haloprofundus marisrubri]